jgi:hypothetical protein
MGPAPCCLKDKGPHLSGFRGQGSNWRGLGPASPVGSPFRDTDRLAAT